MSEARKRASTRRRTGNLTKKIKSVINAVCYDFSESDKQFLYNEVCTRMPILHRTGHGFVEETAALIYLLSKCPANSDKPLKFSEVYKRYSTLPVHFPEDKLRVVISAMRVNGVKTCRINYDTVIQSHKNELYEKAETKGISRPIMTEAIDHAHRILKDPRIRVMCIGRNPYVVVAGVLYYCTNKSFIQIDYANIFKITTPSIRYILYTLDIKFPDWRDIV